MDIDKFMRDLFSNKPVFDMDMDFQMDGCKCGDSCDCSHDDDKCGCGGDHKQGKTMIYGIDIKVGPDGKPIVKEWGNIPSPFDGFPGMGEMPGFGGKETMSEKPKKTNIEVIENATPNGGKIIAEMPGVSKDAFNITVRNITMYIDASLVKAGYNRVYNEKVTLPSYVNSDTIKAAYKNGILEVTFEYDKGIKSQKIKVE